MNWQEIKYKCPKSFKLWLDYLPAIEKVKLKNDFESYCDDYFIYFFRDLYDFFDKNNILIEKLEKRDSWIFCISNDCAWLYVSLRDDPEIKYNLRKEAEIAAFEKSFEVLEERIKE